MKALRQISRGNDTDRSIDERFSSLQVSVETKFDEISADVNTGRAETLRMLHQVLEQVRQTEMNIGEAISRSALSARKHRGAGAPVTSSPSNGAYSGSGYHYDARFGSKGSNGRMPLNPFARSSSRKMSRRMTNGRGGLSAIPDGEASAGAEETGRGELEPLLQHEEHSMRDAAHCPEATMANIFGHVAPAPWDPKLPDASTMWKSSSKPTVAMADGTRMVSTLTFKERLELAQEDMAKHRAPQMWISKQVTAFLEDPESSPAATCYYKMIVWFNVFAIVVGLLPFADIQIPAPYAEELDMFIDAVLFLEIFLRGITCPSYTLFFASTKNLIDLLSVGPLIAILLVHFGDFSPNDRELFWGFLICTSPIIRCLRLIRRFPKMQILVAAFMNCLEALPVLLYTMAVMACMFTSSLYLCEPRDNIHNLAEAGWVILSTMATVGFGDIVPTTPMGHALTSLLMVVSPLYMAMPFGIIGYSFTHIWENRTQILLLQGTRERLAKWGFGAMEIPRLFQLFDIDDDAEIDLDEFLDLFQQMKIGFHKEDVIELFKVIDKDGNAKIDEREFVKTLYPSEYRRLYGRRRLEDGLDGLEGSYISVPDMLDGRFGSTSSRGLIESASMIM